MKKELPWDIIISKLKNDIAPEQQVSLDEWLTEDGNRDIFMQLEELWHELRVNASAYEPDLAKRWQEISARLDFGKSQTSQRPQRTIGNFWKRIAVAAAIIIAATGGYYLSSIIDSQEARPMSYGTLNGKSKVYLPDGTLVWLHNNSTLSYDANFGEKTRELVFTGEAYFEVAHDPKLPFNVKADNIIVQVLGTKFNLRNRTNEDRITVSLLEGAVAVESGGNVTRLTPGNEAIYYRSTGKVEQSEADVSFTTKWIGESISFSGKSLEDITRDLSKWYDIDIKLNDRAKKSNFAYTFTVQGESLEEIMRLISRISPITYYFDEANTLHIDVKP